MLDFLTRYGDIITFYIPVGIIGFWRWSGWVIRKVAGFFYRMPRGSYPATLSVVTPVYNEDPEVFRRALESWKKNDPDEIIAVIDYTDTCPPDQCSIEIFKDFQKKFPDAKLIITHTPGKRPALADGVRAAKSEIVALVDSDTIWSPNIKKYLLGPFSDYKVGGLVPRQDVLKTDTLIRRLFKIHLDLRYLFEFPFLAATGDALICLSGRTAVYRREAIIDKMDALVNETFLGKRMISGDDKTLTHLVQGAGWKTRFLRDVRVYTPGLPDLKSYFEQQIRWTRNGLRSDMKVLGSRWLWRDHKIMGLHMLDKFVQPVALLLSPIYFAASLYFGLPEVAALIAIWWIVSRVFKLYPHLREVPVDIFIVPVYILFSFMLALVKIYAFATIDEQGWITRWDKKRQVGHFLRNLVSIASVSAFVFGLTFVVFNYKSDFIAAARLERQRSQELRLAQKEASLAILTPEKTRISGADLDARKNELIQKTQDDPYGYYVVKIGDTPALLRQKFNLPAASRILNASGKTPISSLAFLRAGQQLAIPIEDLRRPLTPAILTANPFAKPPRVTYDPLSNTIFVRQGGSVATLAKINQALLPANKKLLEQTAPGEWILRANLYLSENVTLVLDGQEVKYFKIKSGEGKHLWIRAEAANILISRTKITSWDEKNSAPDYDPADGRSYITARKIGRMDIIDSELAYLGYAGSPNRGGPFGGSYGVSWKINNGALRNNLLTGVVTGSKFHGNYFGIYTFGATGLLIRNNEFYENIEYGLDPHDDSNNMLIENNRPYHNGNHGIILSRRCFDNIIQNNVSFDNRLHGIMLDRESNNNLVRNNTVYGNVDGFALYNSKENVFLENEAKNNVRGLRLNEDSSENYFTKNTIVQNSRGVYIYDRSQKNMLVENQVKGSDIGITIRNASFNELYGNFQPLDNKRDGRITEDALENNIQ